MRTFEKAFSGGEVTPEFFGRLDDSKFQTGLALCRNNIVRPHGPVANRPGTRYVLETKDSTKKSRLIPFIYSTTQTMVLEFGDKYIRFHTQGATLEAGAVTAWNSGTAYVLGDMASLAGVNYYCILAHTNHTPVNATYWYAIPSIYYEIPTPYLEADLFGINFVQSDDVLTLVHTNYAPMELARFSATKWTLTAIPFTSKLAAPTGVTATAHTAGGLNPVDMLYVVTAVGKDGVEQSLPSASATCNNDIFATGAYNTINGWGAVTGALRYNVYKQSNGLYGLIGQTDTTTFKDDNIAPDLGNTPPINLSPFGGADDYPGAVGYYQGRRDFGGTLNEPQDIWMSHSGTESNFTYSIPAHDDDALKFKISAREANTIRHIVPMTSLVLLTSGAEYRITSINSDAITPISVSVTPQTSVGASQVKPIIVNFNLLFVAARGGHVREMAYAWQYSGFITGDLSLRAPHLFDNYDIADAAFAKSPYPIAWFTSTSGSLLGLTYVPEQQVGAWHHHDSYTNAGQSLFESVCVVPEGPAEDAVYVIVNRVIAGVPKRYIEQFASQLTVNQNDMYFLDCGVSYSGVPIQQLSSGLSHLEGETVVTLADGAVQNEQIVTGGKIVIDQPASTIHVGLRVTAQLQTLPLGYETEAFGQGRQKDIDKVWIRVVNSSGLFAGPTFDALMPYKQRTGELPGAPPALSTGEESIVMSGKWQRNGQVCIQQTDPLPMVITSMTVEASIGA